MYQFRFPTAAIDPHIADCHPQRRVHTAMTAAQSYQLLTVCLRNARETTGPIHLLWRRLAEHYNARRAREGLAPHEGR